MFHFKKILSFVLALALLTGILPPVEVWADEIEEAIATVAQETAAQTSIAETNETGAETEVAETEETITPPETNHTGAAQEMVFLAADQETMSQDEFESALKNSGAIFLLKKSVIVTRDMTISGKEVIIEEGTQLIIASGARLTFSSDAAISLRTGDPIVVEDGGMLVVCEGTRIYTLSGIDSFTVENHGTFVVIRKETDYFRIDNIIGEGNFLFAEHSGDALSVSGHGIISRGDLDEILGQIRNLYFLGNFTEIAENAFADCKTLEELVLPKHLESLGDKAFANCSALKSITFHSDVPRMDDPVSVFQNVSATVHYPENNAAWTEEARASFGNGLTWQTGASEYVFSGTVGSLTWGLDTAGVLTISGNGPMPDYPFYEEQEPWYAYRNSIRKIVVEKGVTTIGSWCFDEHSQLVQVSLPEGLEKIGEGAFRVCTSLNSVNLPETLTNIEDGAFALCGSLKSGIALPSGVKSIGTAFQSSAIESITFSSGLREIRESAFIGCQNLKSVVIPNTVTHIGNGAFHNLDALKRVEIQGGNLIMDRGAFSSCAALEELILREGIREIGEQVFAFNPALKTVEIPGSVVRLDREAFYWCESLETVVLQEGLQTLGQAAFYYCENLSTITLPESLTELGVQALGYCENLREIIFTGDAPEIGSEAFENLKATVYYPIGNPTWTNAVRQNYGGKVTWVKECTKHSLIIQPAAEATCTTDGTTEGSYCEKCGEVMEAQQKIPALGHSMDRREVVREAACTENGEIAVSCSRCGYMVYQTIFAAGHTEVLEKGFAATCTEDGLTDYAYCSECNQILQDQQTIPAPGHSYMAQDDRIVCAVCGEWWTLQIQQDYILMDLQEQNTARLDLVVHPEALWDTIQWSLEGEVGILRVDRDGLVTATDVGTAYVVATVSNGDFAGSARCRIDVMDSARIQGIQLSTTAVTTELYSTRYATLEVLLRLPQERAMTAAAGNGAAPDTGITIENIGFENPDLEKRFDIQLLDSRNIRIVPTEYAMANPKLVAGKYTDKITVTIQGETYTSEMLTLTVKKTLPKLKAAVPALNSFYAGQTQQIIVSGGTVTGISLDPDKIQPDWLTLEGDMLALTDKAPRKNISGKVNLLVETEEWAIPAAVTLTVKNAYKEPTLKLSATSINLNTAVKDTAQVTVTATPAFEELDFRLTDSTGKVAKDGELDVRYENGTLIIAATEQTSGNYKLFLSTSGSKETALTVKTITAKPTVTLKATGNLDLNIPNQQVLITPNFKNYNSGFEIAGLTVVDPKKQDVSHLFRAGQKDKGIYLSCLDEIPTGSYTLTLRLMLQDGTIVENTTKVTVKRTVLKLKLSATKLTLNRLVSDTASITVTSTTKGYELAKPVWELMDKTGKASAAGKLNIDWTDGKLQIATNEATEYGATYKLLVRANTDAPAQTLTIAILAENKSSVTSTLKAKGNIDVIRNESAVTLTATYKNCADAKKNEELVFYKTVGKEQVEVKDLFAYTVENGIFTVTKAANAKLDHSGKYSVQLVTTINGTEVCRSKPTALTVKMGTAKLTLTAEDTVLFAQDVHDRAVFAINSADAALNGVAKIEIKDVKYQDLFEVHTYGDGEFAIGFKDGKVDSSLLGKTITVNFNVFLNGNETTKVNTTVKLKLLILK